MKFHLLVLRTVAAALDQIDVGLCVFDADDRTQLWNDTFLKFFPEHAGHVFVGEHYCENLRRFYRLRLSDEELPALEQYVSEGLLRHQSQQRPFEFNHHDFRVRCASLELSRLGRIRVWRKTEALPTLTSGVPVPPSLAPRMPLLPEVAEALESMADGILMVGHDDRMLWANRQFRSLYGLMGESPLVGARFEDIYAEVWRGNDGTADFLSGQAVLKERQRFAGAPYELALPQDRWVRVIEMRGAHTDGRSFFSHMDVTAMKRQQDELKRLSERLESLAITDALTGLANRRRFDEAMEMEWRRSVRDNKSLALLLMDVDHFKQVNDTHGHPVGDLVLQRLASVLKDFVHRAGDLPARYGGEEFALLLPNTELEAASALAEALRVRVQALDLGTLNAVELRISISVGVSCLRGDAANASTSVLVDRADAALYNAKRLGRNKVSVG